VLLVDTGYAFQALEVFQDIGDSGFTIEGVIISHFHDDHMQGLKVLPKVPVYGSEHFKTALDIWTEKEEHRYFYPTVLIKDTVSIEFGKHRITMIPFPGHSQCTLLTLINGKYLHIADELMFSNESKPVLPMTDPGCIQRHADSLKKLKAYGAYVFLPAHGLELQGAEKIEKQIDKRLAYFNAILNADGRITVEEALRDCDGGFLHSEWHRYVYE